jgi:predicted RNase H-like HicB family nuclease
MKEDLGVKPKKEVHFVPLECRIFPEAGRFIARCEQLRITDHGETAEEAVRNLLETLRLFFESCMNRGTFEDILRSRGFMASELGRKVSEKGETTEPVILPMPWVIESTINDGNRVN